VAVAYLTQAQVKSPAQKSRPICQAIIDAAKGRTVCISKETNPCFGAGWHLGFGPTHSKRLEGLVKKFVVTKEKLFCSEEAAGSVLSQFGEIPDSRGKVFCLTPLHRASYQPDVLLFLVDALTACRLLSLALFEGGQMPQIKIGGPTCRMSIVYPLVTGEINVCFFDYTSRILCKVARDKLLVSVPYARLASMLANSSRCLATSQQRSFLMAALRS